MREIIKENSQVIGIIKTCEFGGLLSNTDEKLVAKFGKLEFYFVKVSHNAGFSLFKII